MSSNRRDFLKKAAIGAAGITIGGVAQGMSAKSYSKIMGANDRLRVAIIGLGRRYSAYIEPIALKESNVELLYLCDVMAKQRENAAQIFAKQLNYKPTLENDVRKVLADPKLDAIFNSTPDHWHAPGTFMAVEAGKKRVPGKTLQSQPTRRRITDCLPKALRKSNPDGEPAAFVGSHQ